MNLKLGKYQRGKDPESAERNKWTGFSVTEKEFDIAEKVQSIAKEINKTPSQVLPNLKRRIESFRYNDTLKVALNWMLCQNRVTAPLIGCRLLRHLEDNLGALEVSYCLMFASLVLIMSTVPTF